MCAARQTVWDFKTGKEQRRAQSKGIKGHEIAAGLGEIAAGLGGLRVLPHALPELHNISCSPSRAAAQLVGVRNLCVHPRAQLPR
jgi:hypothetical protein